MRAYIYTNKFKGGFGWVVHLVYFLSYATVSNFTFTADFTLTAVKLTVHPNPP